MSRPLRRHLLIFQPIFFLDMTSRPLLMAGVCTRSIYFSFIQILLWPFAQNSCLFFPQSNNYNYESSLFNFASLRLLEIQFTSLSATLSCFKFFTLLFLTWGPMQTETKGNAKLGWVFIGHHSSQVHMSSLLYFFNDMVLLCFPSVNDSISLAFVTSHFNSLQEVVSI